MTAKSDRLELLDGLRGIAAICVMWFHFRGVDGQSWLEAAHGRLAVDFFFLLSGFVIARAYEQKLLTGMSWGRFALVRSIRFAPMLWLGVFAMTALTTAQTVAHHGEVQAGPLAVSLVFALANLPDLSRAPLYFFALLPPRWSLFYEMLINLVYAAAVCHLSEARLLVIIAASFIGLIAMDPQFGIHDPSVLVSICRTSFSFFVGVYIYRRYSNDRLPRLAMPAWLIAVLLIAVLMAPAGLSIEPYFAGFAAAVVFPLLLISSCFASLSGIVRSIATFLGEISYPLYVLHLPVLFVALPVLNALGLSKTDASFAAMIPAVVASFICGRWVDEPSRAWLSEKLRPSALRRSEVVG